MKIDHSVLEFKEKEIQWVSSTGEKDYGENGCEKDSC